MRQQVGTNDFLVDLVTYAKRMRILEKTVDGQVLRSVMRRVPSPVTVVTAKGEKEIRGITIGSFTSVSVEPCLISFNLRRTSRMHEVISTTSHFAVHILSHKQAHLSLHFAAPGLTGVEQFRTIPHYVDAQGVPILNDALAVINCRLYNIFEAGDHSIILGEAIKILEMGRGLPILFYDRSYRSVGEIIDSSAHVQKLFQNHLSECQAK